MKSENLPFKVSPGFCAGEINAPTSKSHANRALIMAAISEDPIEIINLPPAKDVKEMIMALRSLGVIINSTVRGVRVENSFPACEEKVEHPIVVKTGEGGTTTRFILSLLALGKNAYKLVPSGPMLTRPMEDGVKVLERLKVKVTKEEEGTYLIKGPLNVEPDETIKVDCEKSTQFLSGFKLALSGAGVKVKSVNLNSSEKYVELTDYIINSFKNGLSEYPVPPDYSSLGYPIAFAAVTGEVRINNVSKIDSFQPDSHFVKILQDNGCDITLNDNSLAIRSKSLSPIELSCEGFPDLVPTLCYICSFIKGSSTLKNLKVLRHKESDRLAEIQNILNLYKVENSYDEEKDELVINGKDRSEFDMSKVTYRPPADHRMVMVMYLFMTTINGGQIFDSHHVNKSYASFFNDMDKLKSV